jgi:shikimate kinase
MSNTILLIYGVPGAGKSWLGDNLRDRHGFKILDLDREYVEFFKNYRRELYFGGIQEQRPSFRKALWDSRPGCPDPWTAGAAVPHRT